MRMRKKSNPHWVDFYKNYLSKERSDQKNSFVKVCILGIIFFEGLYLFTSLSSIKPNIDLVLLYGVLEDYLFTKYALGCLVRLN